ncbi:MAG: VOC family protein [Proteobacteria bacterium]|nr:VOC family protein [Pseudomonadota bacterium]
MKVKKLDHLCIAVRDLEAARKLWEPVLGKSGPDDAYEHDPEQIRVARYWIGEVGLELMASTTPDGPVAQWIEKHGEGLMLLGLNVDDTRAAVAELQGRGYPFIPDARGEVARPFRDCEFAFLHPKKLNGVLTEVIDDRWGELREK